MCSTFKYENCMGRNFDYEISYDEKLQIIERNDFNNKYKVMGMTTGLVTYPLLYDGMNEKGLCCSALAFEGNAKYWNIKEPQKHCIPSYNFVFWVLGNHNSVESVIKDLENLNGVGVIITDRKYSDDFPNSDLHWFVCDKENSIIIEQTKEGLIWHYGDVMTNNPPYTAQQKLYKECVKQIGTGHVKDSIYYTRGIETSYLPGSYTSEDRFIRLSWLKNKMEECSVESKTFIYSPNLNVSNSFHLLSSVEQIYSATPVKDKFEYTIYSVVYDMIDLKIYIKLYPDYTIKIKSLNFLLDK